jgi:hypothetical protein
MAQPEVVPTLLEVTRRLWDDRGQVRALAPACNGSHTYDTAKSLRTAWGEKLRTGVNGWSVNKNAPALKSYQFAAFPLFDAGFMADVGHTDKDIVGSLEEAALVHNQTFLPDKMQKAWAAMHWSKGTGHPTLPNKNRHLPTCGFKFFTAGGLPDIGTTAIGGRCVTGNSSTVSVCGRHCSVFVTHGPANFHM